MIELNSLSTPSLVLDVDRVKRNARKISDIAIKNGVRLRPHIKTHKCVEVARIQTAGHSGAITTSTLEEVRAFADRGFSDFTYAVPIEPGKFAAAIELAKRDLKLGLITDNAAVPSLLDEAARKAGVKFDVYLKVDCGYHRCGVEPETDDALDIPRRISGCSNLNFAGILTHAGHSYHCDSREEILAVARQERDTMASLAERIRTAGVDVPTVSIGSTPTMNIVDHLQGIDEIRPGNYVFFDAFQATIGSCAFEDCALTVLAAVVHRDRSRRKVIIDAGGIALSKDRGAVDVDPSCGYGRVLDLEGNDLGLRVSAVSQEHGTVLAQEDHKFDKLQIGTRVRVVANHSCLTAAQHSHYNVVEGDKVVDKWAIHRGW